MEKRDFKNAVQESLHSVFDYRLKKELDHLRYVFQKHNDYPKWIIKQVAKQAKDQNIHSNVDKASIVANDISTNSKTLKHFCSPTLDKKVNI